MGGAAPFLIPVTLYFVYATRVMPELRVFKHVLRGYGYMNLGRLRLAIQFFRRAVELDPNSPLANPAKLRTPVLAAGCLNEILSMYQSLTASQLLVGGALSTPLVNELVHYVNPAQQPSSAPILLIQGTEDEAVPYDITAEALLPELQQYPQPVQFVPVQGADHDGAVTATTSLVANWIAARFS